VKQAKLIVISTALCALLAPSAAFAATAEQSKAITPYFNMALAEYLNMPSQGNFFSGGRMDTDLGLLGNINEKNSIFALYNFRYVGPSFYPQDSSQFQDRSLSHYLNLEYRLKLGEFRIRPGVAKTMGKRKTGSNEAWDTGLYNMDSSGWNLAADWLYELGGKGGALTAKYLARKVEFPNYTDLLREFQGAGSAAELSGGLQNQNLTQLSLRNSWSSFTMGVSRSGMDYVNQTVVDISGVYGSEKQNDTSTSVDFGMNTSFWLFEFYPNIEYTAYRSNQNFLRYKYFGAVIPSDITNPSADVTFMADNYSYNELSFRIPLDVNMGAGAKWAISGAMEVIRRNYVSRLARDANNNYKSDTQSNLLTRFSVGFRKHLNDIADMRLSYTFTVAESNNTFEKYMPYNYTGHSLGLAYNIRY